MTGWIGISIGDVTGIGPEVTLKALAAERQDTTNRYLLLGDWHHLRNLNEAIGTALPLVQQSEAAEGDRFVVFNPLAEPLPERLEAGSPAAARASVAWLKEGACRCLAQSLDALVTAPVNKESIILSGQPFIGQTEFLSELAGTTRTAMMLLGHDEKNRWLRVVLATTHVPIRFVADHLTQEKIELAIELAAQACRDLKLPRQRVAVCGLNPHAGEGGQLGSEDAEVIEPAVKASGKHGLDVAGPFAADALFYYVFKAAYDAVVAMYHDQGLVPLTLIGF
mgnify:FL=1